MQCSVKLAVVDEYTDKGTQMLVTGSGQKPWCSAKSGARSRARSYRPVLEEIGVTLYLSHNTNDCSPDIYIHHPHNISELVVLLFLIGCINHQLTKSLLEERPPSDFNCYFCEAMISCWVKIYVVH